MWLAAGIIVGLIGGAAWLVAYCFVLPILPAGAGAPRLAVDAAGEALARRLEAHVRGVASQPHNLAFPDALEASARYIEATLHSQGHTPLAQVFMVGDAPVRNIEVVIEPTLPAPQPGRSTSVGTLVVGAHYDAPDDCPGANDNGTGVAALLELAANLRGVALRQRVRLVFFVNEEQPYGKTPAMGSYQHAQRLKTSGEPVMGMFALETLGYFSDEPGSQTFPFPLGVLLPKTGNFIAFVGMVSARAFVHHAVRSFRAVSAFPAMGGVAPAAIEGIDLSDHWAYDHFGFPACMITDTAPFRNPYYHQLHDTPDNVDYANLAQVTQGLTALFVSMAGGTLTVDQRAPVPAGSA